MRRLPLYGETVGSRIGYADGRESRAEVQPKGVVRDYLDTILICVIFVLFTRAFVFQQSKIPSGSMLDTLLIGDYIMVNRFVYAPTVSEWERAVLPVREVRRGDVIVFKFPDTPEVDYIKRVIGLPGDTVEIQRGVVLINGKPIDEPYVEPTHLNSREVIPPIRVEPDHYFVMGDNRSSSADSRVWGQLSRKLVKGRALLIWLSVDSGEDRAVPPPGQDRLRRALRAVLTAPTMIRWGRLFTIIR
jgi:signal peptidase I